MAAVLEVLAFMAQVAVAAVPVAASISMVPYAGSLQAEWTSQAPEAGAVQVVVPVMAVNPEMPAAGVLEYIPLFI